MFVMAAGDTCEDRWVLTVLRCDMPTARTCPARVHGRNFDYATLSLVLGAAHYEPPALFEDASVQPSFLRGTFVTGIVYRSLGAAGHIGDTQILKDDRVELGSESI